MKQWGIEPFFGRIEQKDALSGSFYQRHPIDYKFFISLGQPLASSFAQWGMPLPKKLLPKRIEWSKMHSKAPEITNFNDSYPLIIYIWEIPFKNLTESLRP